MKFPYKKLALSILAVKLLFTFVGCVFNPTEEIPETTQKTIFDVTENSDTAQNTEVKPDIDTESFFGIGNKRYSEIKSISEKTTYTNNLFAYEDISIGEYDEEFGSIIISTKSIKNISDRGQAVNIRIKLYDENKSVIAIHQHRQTRQEYDESDPFHLAPEGTNNATFTIYDDDLPEGKTLADVKYYSIGDIKY